MSRRPAARSALERLRQHLARDDEAAARAAATARWHLHDELVRGDPVRVERPAPAPGGRAGRRGARGS